MTNNFKANKGSYNQPQLSPEEWAAKKQAESFKGLVTEVLGNESTFNQVKTLQDEIHNYLQEKKDALSGESGALTIKKEDIKEILGKSGVSSEKLENFDESFENHFGRKVDLTTGEIIGEEEVPFDEDDETLNADILSADSGDDGKETREEAGEVSEEHPTKDAYNDKRIFAENLIPSKKFEVKTADVIVRINSDKTDLVETRIIDGEKCLVIKLEKGLVVNGIPVKD